MPTPEGVQTGDGDGGKGEPIHGSAVDGDLFVEDLEDREGGIGDRGLVKQVANHGERVREVYCVDHDRRADSCFEYAAVLWARKDGEALQ